MWQYLFFFRTSILILILRWLFLRGFIFHYGCTCFCGWVCKCGCSSHRGQKGASGTLEQELEAVESHLLWVLGMKVLTSLSPFYKVIVILIWQLKKLTFQKVRKWPRVPPQIQCRACRSASHTLPRGWLSPYSLLRVQTDGCHLTSMTLCPGEGCHTSQFLHLRRKGEQEVTGQGPSWPSRDFHADTRNCGRAGRRLSIFTVGWRWGLDSPDLLFFTHNSQVFLSHRAPW